MLSVVEGIDVCTWEGVDTCKGPAFAAHMRRHDSDIYFQIELRIVMTNMVIGFELPMKSSSPFNLRAMRALVAHAMSDERAGCYCEAFYLERRSESQLTASVGDVKVITA